MAYQPEQSQSGQDSELPQEALPQTSGLGNQLQTLSRTRIQPPQHSETGGAGTQQTAQAIDTIVKAIMPTVSQAIEQQVTAALQRQTLERDIQDDE